MAVYELKTIETQLWRYKKREIKVRFYLKKKKENETCESYSAYNGVFSIVTVIFYSINLFQILVIAYRFLVSYKITHFA